MKKEFFSQVEGYMQSCMKDSAHDMHHIYRVLYYALEIAAHDPAVDHQVLITACLLHDIGRPEQFADATVCHAQAGAEKAAAFLREQNCHEDFILKVCHCIRAHRFSKKSPPETIEAKILFDADKLDVVGAMGVARTLQYQGTMDHPLYTLTADGTVSDGTDTESPSFFQEYKRKLERLYDGFFTEPGQQLARMRQAAAVDFYNNLFAELSRGYQIGKPLLETYLQE